MAGLFRLSPGGAAFAPERRLIAAADYQAWIDGQAYLEAARARAAEIELEAKEAYERERERGYADGLAEANARAVEQMMDTVAGTVAYFASVEKQMTELVLTATAKVLGEFDDRALVVRVVHNALRVMRNQKQVTLRVAPEQVENVQHHLTEIMADYAGISFVDVSGDARLRAGGCILESELGIVDASIDVQLDALRRALAKAFEREAL